MSSRPNFPPARNSGSPRPKATSRRQQHVDHAEIVRMAEAEASSRAAERHDMIATAAYYRAQQRDFEPGHELEDWLAAETEVTHAQQVSVVLSGADTP